MARKLKEEGAINPSQIAGALITLFSFVPLAFDVPYIWVLTIVLAVAGLALLSYGYVLAFRLDPNAGDPEPRKALGRRYAVWGEQLDELLAGQALAHILMRHDDAPGLAEVFVAAGMVAVPVGVQYELYWLVGQCLDGRIDLRRHWGVLVVDHEHGIIADGQAEITACAKHHVRGWREFLGFDLCFVEILGEAWCGGDGGDSGSRKQNRES